LPDTHLGRDVVVLEQIGESEPVARKILVEMPKTHVNSHPVEILLPKKLTAKLDRVPSRPRTNPFRTENSRCRRSRINSPLPSSPATGVRRIDAHASRKPSPFRLNMEFSPIPHRIIQTERLRAPRSGPEKPHLGHLSAGRRYGYRAPEKTHLWIGAILPTRH
jgi:hypothetical protein